MSVRSFLAIDIGNSSLRAGWFPSLDTGAAAVPQASSIWRGDSRQPDLASLGSWIAVQATSTAVDWQIASVYRPGTSSLLAWLAADRPDDTAHVVTSTDLPLRIAVAHPERVGVDRLLAAVAANQLRPPHEPAIVIDAGSAVTIDSIGADGTFLGGLILPGRTMMLRALAQADLLPELDWHDQPTPDLIGAATESALLGGVFWGQIGAIEGIVTRLRKQLGGNPAVIASAGELALLSQLVSHDIQHVPHLVLGGIALMVAWHDKH